MIFNLKWFSAGNVTKLSIDIVHFFPKNFIGPSSFTLQMENIGETDDDDAVPNIRNNYTVTDKADGDRCIGLITNSKLYLIFP